MKGWPWIMLVLSAVAVLNPLGLGVIYSAFLSSEQLSRNIWRPIALIAMAIVVVLTALEWWIRRRWRRRRMDRQL